MLRNLNNETKKLVLNISKNTVFGVFLYSRWGFALCAKLCCARANLVPIQINKKTAAGNLPFPAGVNPRQSFGNKLPRANRTGSFSAQHKIKALISTKAEIKALVLPLGIEPGTAP